MFRALFTRFLVRLELPFLRPGLRTRRTRRGTAVKDGHLATAPFARREASLRAVPRRVTLDQVGQIVCASGQTPPRLGRDGSADGQWRRGSARRQPRVPDRAGPIRQHRQVELAEPNAPVAIVTLRNGYGLTAQCFR